MNSSSSTAHLKPQDLGDLHTAEEIADWLLKSRQDLFAASNSPELLGLRLTNSLSDIVDLVVQRMLSLAMSNAGLKCDPSNVPIAIVATGGYGRRQLCPFSDIDITFIPHHDGDPHADKIIKEMFSMVMKVFMDKCGLQVGYAYRLIEDCSNLDHKTCSGLLDARFVAGNSRILIHFESEFWSYFNSAEFIFTKLIERKNQIAKAGGTPRIIEPDVKEGAGGFRDIQCSMWLIQARKLIDAGRVRGEKFWIVLGKEATLSDEDLSRLQSANEFLFQVRNALHIIVGAERDQLVVTRQEEVAEKLGYGGKEDLVDNSPPVETFMRNYYYHVSQIDRICSEIRNKIEYSRIVLGIGLDCKRRQIVPANTALISEDPMWMLWACDMAQRYELEFSSDLKSMMYELCATNPPVSDYSQAGELLANILSSHQGAYPTLKKMAETGILNWLLPEVGQAMDLIPYDPSHDYTVGQHTLYVVKFLDMLRLPSDDEEMRDYRMTMSDLRHPEQLYMAALLHDVGKLDAKRPHAEVGEELSESVCKRLGWNRTAMENVQFLVRNHLLMSETSRLLDLNLDSTIRDFVAVVDNLERLYQLYLLTYADTNAVADGIWSQLKSRFQRTLLLKAERALTSDDYEDMGEENLNRARKLLQRQLSLDNMPEVEIEEHIRSMPATYLLNTPREEVSLHIGYVRKAKSGTPVIDFMDERDTTFTEVTVCTLDDPTPGLLAKITAVFYACDLDVHSAQVHTRVADDDQRIAIDKFTVDFRTRQLTPGKRKEVTDYLTELLTGRITVEEILKKRKKSPETGGAVSELKVSIDESSNYSVIQVAAFEDKSMLYRACGALSRAGMDIVSARVSPFRGENVAVFYVPRINEGVGREMLETLSKLMPVVADRRR